MQYLSSRDFNWLQLLKVRYQNLGADPGSPAEGWAYYNTVTHKLRVFNGTTWDEMGVSTYVAENARDDIAAAFAAGTQTGIGFVHNDPSDSFSLTVAGVTNAMRANQAQATIKGRQLAGGTGPEEDLTPAQAKLVLAILHADISDFDTGVRLSTLNQMAAPTADLPMASHKITGLADGVSASDAATFGQISAAVQAFDWHEPVRAATTAAITTILTGAPNIIDGVTLLVGDRVLAKNQTAHQEDGIYVVNTVGTGVNGVWARATDMDIVGEANNATVLIEEGTVGQGDIYTQTATIVTLGTTPMAWTKVSEGNTVYTADGTTLDLVGTQFNVKAGGIAGTQLNASVAGAGLTGGAGSALAVGAGTGVSVAADTVGISAGGVGATELAAAVAGAGLTGGAGSALAVGAGTGISVAADVVGVDTAVVVRKYAVSIGDGSATSYVVTHGLGTKDITYSVRFVADDSFCDCDVVSTSTTTTTFTFGVAPATNSIRVTIHG